MPTAKPATSGPAVQISPDKMKAVLRVPADTPPDTVTAEGLTTLASSQGLKVDDSVRAHLQETATQFRSCPHAMELTVAEGKAAVPGEDGRLVWQPGLDPNAKASAKNPDGSTNFYEWHAFQAVDKDQHIATLIAPSPGEPGADVTGQMINPTAGKAFPLKLDATVRQDAEGKIFANRPGLLNYANGAIRINPVLDIRGNVDFSTGNVKFIGSVTVGGGVCDRFQLECTEDAFVKGLIEAAQIKCGRHLNAEGGMAGREQGAIELGGDLIARHIVGVRGKIAGHVKVQREIINSIFQINGNLEVPEGPVIGGDISVGGSVHVSALGSNGGVTTFLRVGFDPKYAQEIQQLSIELESIDQQLAKPGKEVTAQMLATLRQRRPLILKKLVELRKASANGPVNLSAVKGIFHGVTLVGPGFRFEFFDVMKGPVTLRRAADGTLVAHGVSGAELPLAKHARSLKTTI